MTINGTVVQVRGHTNNADRIRVTVADYGSTLSFDTEATPAWYVGRTVTITIELMGT